MTVARIQAANQEIKVKMEDQDKQHALEAKRFEMDTAYYGKISQALASSTREHDITKEKLARAAKVIEDEKRRQILVRDQRDNRVRVLIAEWEAKLKVKETESMKIIAERDHCIAERDHYMAERDYYFRQMKIHQKEVGRLQQENTELRLVNGIHLLVFLSRFWRFVSALMCQFLTCLIDTGMMNPHSADILELKEMVRDLFSVVQGLALGQKAMAERLERIEGWMIKEKVLGKALSSEVTNPSVAITKKPPSSGQLKKEVESNGVPAKKERGKDRYHPYAATATIPVGSSPAPQKTSIGAAKDVDSVKKPDKRPVSYDENAKCEFHSDAPGHDVENCKAFKHIVQDLVDSKAINFAQFPNVNANHMPAYGQMGMNAISKDRRTIGLMNGDQLKAPRPVVPKPLMKEGAFPSVDTCCAAVATEGCVLMGDMTQKLKEVEMDCGKFETPCQAVEAVTVKKAIIAEKKKKKPSIFSYKQALEVVRNGGIPGWGKIIGIVVKADMFGIDYQPDQGSSRQYRERRPPFTFVSAGMFDSDYAYTVGEEIGSNQEKVIQPHEERVEIVIPSAAKVRKEMKMGAVSEASREQNGSPVEGACGHRHLVVSRYARVGYRCRCAQAAMKRRLSSRGADAGATYQRAMVTLFHDMIHHEIE
ncbi:hypothetical protein KIW84_043615 [Lathyrus oleraceus]|uniref:Uncharacterized protein n=1 Tax=Pisum sativum TaxID=3888 RepID=A0A9D5AU99_PEA|nr:hypothetical protein KIW84_043615 [Pisum sativum]